jgi:hypothetical protein
MIIGQLLMNDDPYQLNFDGQNINYSNPPPTFCGKDKAINVHMPEISFSS